MSKAAKRDGFGSRFGAIAAAAGSAIGLGNIWKFPYLAGKYGGGAFILIYLISVVLICLPIMIAELSIGRKAKLNAIGAFKKLEPGKPWFLIGWAGFISAFTILSFYGVVGGWTFNYVYQGIIGSFGSLDAAGLGTFFNDFIQDDLSPIYWQVIFMALTGIIVYLGVQNGIEKWSKVLMPLLFVLIIILDIRALMLPGAAEGLKFMFDFDFSKVQSAQAVLEAMGQAFFSLSLGMGVMLTYGSYIGDKEGLRSTAVNVTIADTMIAILAGVAIFPAAFTFGIDPGNGPGLAFVTLPNIFNQIAGGGIFNTLFFLLLALAALTSSISILEFLVVYFSEEFNITRHKSTLFTTIVVVLTGIPCSLAMGSWQDVLIFGMNFFDLFNYISSNLLMPIGGMFIAIYIAWFFGKDRLKSELGKNGKVISDSFINVYRVVGGIIAPIAILIIFLFGINVLS